MKGLIKIRENLENQNKRRLHQNRKVIDIESYKIDKKNKPNPSRKKKKSFFKKNKKTANIGNKTTSKKVNKRSSQIGHDFMKIIILLLLFIGIFSIIVFRYSKISLIKYDMIDINNEISELDNEIKVLNLKVDEINSSKVMEEKAKELGMKFRSKDKIIYVLVE